MSIYSYITICIALPLPTAEHKTAEKRRGEKQNAFLLSMFIYHHTNGSSQTKKTKCNYIFQDKINQGNKQQNILSWLYIIMLSCKYIIIATHQTRETKPAPALDNITMFTSSSGGSAPDWYYLYLFQCVSYKYICIYI